MKFKRTFFTKRNNKYIIVFILLGICFVASLSFVQNNHSLYERSIAQLVETNLVASSEVIDRHGNKDILFTQTILAEIKNGEEKGQLIQLVNEYSTSGAYDQQYEVENEVFVTIDEREDGSTYLTGTIEDVKRDKYVLYVAWIFIFILLLVGKKQGLFSLVSLVINAILLSYALDLYLSTYKINLLVISCISVILFTVISLLIVNGFNLKTYAAVVATLLGTFSLLIITYVVMAITEGAGLRYEGMQFFVRPPEMMFMVGVLIGSLGAVMDIAITMSSSIFSLYEKNKKISVQALKTSGLGIGRDIMGTMTNILFFVYISGSIPILILYFMNSVPFGYTISINLSLELARALAGGIGIVLAIPIGLYTSIFFVNRMRAKA
ncbi:YibE/F family protein [Alkalihalobacillus sp. 1P02AB]|uniref:YibE/F family protein n=1 Tax=Alkalihalobacillus sp. 1P02AB TaxID=3132260 RepID=UPI0039A720C7